jgi:uncharacterized membrane-anchored protein YitT (DUF2179 family)
MGKYKISVQCSCMSTFFYCFLINSIQINFGQVVMVHGLSRNGRDFDPLALYISAKLGITIIQTLTLINSLSSLIIFIIPIYTITLPSFTLSQFQLYSLLPLKSLIVTCNMNSQYEIS